MATRYTLKGLDETVERRLSDHSLAVAQTLEAEGAGTELLSRRTIEALADRSQRVGERPLPNNDNNRES